MASSCSGRKCARFVSKVGSTSTARPPSTPDAGVKWSAATVAVVVVAAVAAAALVAVVIVLRLRRIRAQEMRAGDVRGDMNHGEKAERGEEGVGEGAGKWSAGAVELVVMAGETKPTYLATPTIQCPPFILAKSEDQ